MKKALSLILSVVMLISVMAGLNVTAFAGSVVDKVDIYNVPEPVAGAQPDFMAQQYDVYDRNGVVDKYVFSSGYYRDGIAWYDFTEGTYVNPNDSTYVYKCGHTYKASFTVYIPDTQGGNILFEYPTRMDVTVNGNTAEVDYSNKASSGEDEAIREISYYFGVAGTHKWDAGKVTKKATTTAFGTKTYTCAVCGETKTEKIKKINPITVKAKTKVLKAKNLKKKAATIARKDVIAVSKAQGAVTYKKASGNKKITVAKNGKVTVKKGTKKGTYKIKVNVTAAGNKNYAKKTKTVTFTVKVK